MCALILEIWFGMLIANFLNFFYSYLPAICPYFRFRMITLVNVHGFSSNLVCAFISWRSGLQLLMGKFCLFLTDLSARSTSVFLFQGNNLSNSQWIFTEFDMCIGIVEIWFGIAHWQISSIFDSYLPAT